VNAADRLFRGHTRMEPVNMKQAAPTIRVLCVDDRPDVTDVLRLLLESQVIAEMKCVGCLASADMLVETVRGLKPPPDVVLLDASMPGRDPFEAMTQLREEVPQTKTIVFSGYEDEKFMDMAMEAGAWGCISKYDPTPTIVQAVIEVAMGRTFFPRLMHPKC
jgi:DNA-binding NarL/FixJ family response regulator